jgi:hypothetical protein
MAELLPMLLPVLYFLRLRSAQLPEFSQLASYR